MSNITFVFWHFQSRNNCFINVLFLICIMSMKKSIFLKQRRRTYRSATYPRSPRKVTPSGTWNIQISVSALLFINSEKRTSNKILSNTEIKFIRYHCGTAKLHSAETIDSQKEKQKRDDIRTDSQVICVCFIGIDEQHGPKYHFCYLELRVFPIESEPKNRIDQKTKIWKWWLLTSVFSHFWNSTRRSALAIASLASNSANRIPIQLLEMIIY
jgi:hypothetical protein